MLSAALVNKGTGSVSSGVTPGAGGLTTLPGGVAAADPRENVLVDLIGPLQVQEMASIVDHDHARGRGEETLGAAGQSHADAAVPGCVQVQGGLRRLAADRLLLARIARGRLC
jgi:hypothetical protein